jgi:hypothetical protein
MPAAHPSKLAAFLPQKCVFIKKNALSTKKITFFGEKLLTFYARLHKLTTLRGKRG